MDSDPKFCINCKHYRPAWSYLGAYGAALCYSPTNQKDPDLETGYRGLKMDPGSARLEGNWCGPGAAGFEPKPPAPIRVSSGPWWAFWRRASRDGGCASCDGCR